MTDITQTYFTEENRNQKVIAVKDEKVNHCYIFQILNEDHTLGNLLVEELLKDEKILFAGYRIKHPLKDWIIVRVQSSVNINQPKDLVETAVNNVVKNLRTLRNSFESSLADYESHVRTN